MLQEVRSCLLDEARNSPNLLSDLAGLENYIAEAYDSRCLAELLQNADDAMARHFSVIRLGATLAVANDGRLFSREDFESLCRSAASHKSRGSTIGYRGIGFKSVVGIADRVYLISGDLECVFCRIRTASEVPNAKRVPLVRIPHELTAHEKEEIYAVTTKLKADGLFTAFIFTGLSMRRVNEEINSFDPCTLLFLNHLSHVELKAEVVSTISLERRDVSPIYQKVSLSVNDDQANWNIVKRNGVSIAALERNGEIVSLDDKDALVHAFLPTQETTGLGVRVNGDFSTEPSRTRVVFDERTSDVIRELCSLISEILENTLIKKKEYQLSHFLRALTPHSDPRVLLFQRHSFKTELFSCLNSNVKPFFGLIRLRPSWLNYIDFEKLIAKNNVPFMPHDFEDVPSIVPFLKFLGAADAKFDDLSGTLMNIDLSISGAAELVAHLTSLRTTRAIDVKGIEHSWRLWPIAGTMLPLTDAVKSDLALDRDFVDLVVEKVGSISSISKLIEELTNQESAATLLKLDSVSQLQKTFSESRLSSGLIDQPDKILSESKSFDQQMNRGEQPARAVQLSVQRWRRAEEQLMEILTAQGWKLTDVSRQNIGYDIEGHDEKGNNVCVEVKSINYPGQPFIMTSNEEAVAREKGAHYLLGLVRQANEYLEVVLIPDPVSKLRFVRQCRQWVWECSAYSFEPALFRLT